VKRFFGPYGESAKVHDVIPGDLPEVPEQFAVYRNFIGRLLRRGMVIGALLPFVLYPLQGIGINLQHFALDEALSGVPILSAACGAGATFEVFRLWYIFMGMQMLVLLSVVVLKFPFDLLGTLWQRVKGFKVKAITVCAAFGGGYLMLKLFVFGRGGCLAVNTAPGHARGMLLAMQDSIFGMAIIGPILWMLCFFIWAAAIFHMLYAFYWLRRSAD